MSDPNDHCDDRLDRSGMDDLPDYEDPESELKLESTYFCIECYEFHWESHKDYQTHIEFQNEPLMAIVAKGIAKGFLKVS